MRLSSGMQLYLFLSLWPSYSKLACVSAASPSYSNVYTTLNHLVSFFHSLFLSLFYALSFCLVVPIGRSHRRGRPRPYYISAIHWWLGHFNGRRPFKCEWGEELSRSRSTEAEASGGAKGEGYLIVRYRATLTFHMLCFLSWSSLVLSALSCLVLFFLSSCDLKASLIWLHVFYLFHCLC